MHHWLCHKVLKKQNAPPPVDKKRNDKTPNIIVGGGGVRGCWLDLRETPSGSSDTLESKSQNKIVPKEMIGNLQKMLLFGAMDH